MAVRDEIVWRSGIIYLVIVLAGIALLARILVLQYLQHGKWSDMGDKYVYKRDEMPANRGDILTYDGRLLASDVPYYTIYMDTRSTGMSEETWTEGIDGLSQGLARLFRERSAGEWKSLITAARKEGNRYLLIKRRVDFETLIKIKELPVLREGRYKGGLLAQMENRRILPNSELAARTIGYLNLGEQGNVVGIEGAFDSELAGRNGVLIKQRLTGGDWITVNDANSVKSENGNDIVTTIDIDLQDVASSALLKQLQKNNAHHGCAVLMEVATGDIRAIANLEQGSDGRYHETYNYAIGESTEPGSTFKLPVFMAALEDGVVDTGDIVDTGDGSVRYYNKIIRDTHEEGYGQITIMEAFAKSSNVGASKIIYENYRDNPEEFVNRLYTMKLGDKLDLKIKGEGIPLIRYPGDTLWSGLSLPMMSHGYEVQLTPLQILAFYNAVANDGKMMRPRFVSAIVRNGIVVKNFKPEVIIDPVASRSTIRKARKMMEEVVEHGTATNLRNNNYRIAGKTGTAQIARDKHGYRQGATISYQASFVGYFPAEEPLYSCIVVVNAPSNGVYYGNLVAGSVFKEISDKVYSKNFFRDHRAGVEEMNNSAPEAGNGFRDDIDKIFRTLDVRYERSSDYDWIKTNESGDTVRFGGIEIEEGLVPDVRGMTLRDAIYLLENAGLRVRYSGKGKVLRQSPEHGAKCYDGTIVSLEMHM